MSSVFKVIFVNPDESVGPKLIDKIKPGYEFPVCKQVKTAREAIQEMIANPYDVCFMADSFEAGDLVSLVNDIAQLPLEHRGTLLQTATSLVPDFDRYSRVDLGVAAVVSLEFSDADRAAFVKAVQPRIDALKMVEMMPEIDAATSALLRDLDFAASEKKRGREWNLKSLAKNFIAQQTSVTKEVSGMFFDALTKISGASTSFPEGKLDVPKDLLARKPPGLEGDEYTGPSRRVWEKLHKKFGRPTPKE